MISRKLWSLGTCSFIDGSDAQILMGNDEDSVVRLWREKRHECDAEDFSGNLIAQLGKATNDLNRSLYERNTGRRVRNVQHRVRHGLISWMGATLDGVVEGIEAVFESKFIPAWCFSEEAAVKAYMPQLQHNMWVTNLRSSVLSIITGDGQWVEITVPIDPLYLSLLVAAEKKFWRCVRSGERPYLVNSEPPRPRIEAVRIVDMSSSEAWAEVAALFRGTQQAYLDHERSKQELEALFPKGVHQAIGHGVRGCRSESGALTFDVVDRHVVTRDVLEDREIPLAPVK